MKGVVFFMNRTKFLLPEVYLKVLLQLGYLLIISQLIRVAFLGIHFQYFSVDSLADYFEIFYYSLRFDLSSIVTVNFLYLALTLCPAIKLGSTIVRRLLAFLFVISNAVAFIFDIADIGYYPYVRRRMTAEVFHLIGKKSDFLDLLPNYLIKFWYVSILIVLLIAILFFISKRIAKIGNNQVLTFSSMVLYLLGMGGALVAVRGGLQLRPITISNAVVIDQSENIPLILNTPFSILKTLESEKLEDLNFFTNEELKTYYNPIKNYGASTQGERQAFKNQNVVVIILESFGKGFTGIGGRRSFTPFLDSLMGISRTFDFAFANAYRSADGIPAIISGIPYFMNDPFPLSPFATNQIDALPSLLKQKGYATSFFHGGTNGTMSFDSYCKNAGFDKYFGRKEYGNDDDYDGTWGIWDENFLQFFSSTLSKEKEPFFSTVFTLSSHEPFAIPKKDRNQPFAQLKGIERGIAYADRALQTFFQSVSKTAWFDNTLFIITADHNFLAYNDSLGYYNQGLGLFSIPVLFYSPKDASLKGIDHHLMQQLDIMPSILDYMNYDKPFFSFGNSVFDSTTASFCYASINNQFYMLQSPYLITAQLDKVNGYYDYRTDSTLKNNLITSPDSSFLYNKNRYHAFLQLLHHSIIHNQQSFQTFQKQGIP
jgi:phosphoglycerol transferase MdoB-like AlkP superfamily enzyme